MQFNSSATQQQLVFISKCPTEIACLLINVTKHFICIFSKHLVYTLNVLGVTKMTTPCFQSKKWALFGEK